MPRHIFRSKSFVIATPSCPETPLPVVVLRPRLVAVTGMSACMLAHGYKHVRECSCNIGLCTACVACPIFRCFRVPAGQLNTSGQGMEQLRSFLISFVLRSQSNHPFAKSVCLYRFFGSFGRGSNFFFAEMSSLKVLKQTHLPLFSQLYEPM